MIQHITPDLLRRLSLPHYAPESSKNDYGKLLVVAGSARLPGAALLAARAALRCGCGTVRVAAPQSVATLLAIQVPELMAIPLPETSNGTLAREAFAGLEKQFEPCNAVVLGPGLDEGDEVREVCLRVLHDCPLPTLVDASALAALEGDTVQLGANTGPRVLTPHEGEMKLLSRDEVPPEDELEARADFACAWAQQHDATLALKGRATLIAAPDGNVYANTSGTRGMGTAGSGDTLAGAVGSFLAQHLPTDRAAIWGVTAHALAGERAAQSWGDDGLMASDFLELLPVVLRDLRLKTV